MFEFKELTDVPIDELFRILGMCDFTYLETSSFLESLESYRSQVLKEIQNAKEKSNDKNLDTRSRPDSN